jgi:hypothetical protein
MASSESRVLRQMAHSVEVSMKADASFDMVFEIDGHNQNVEDDGNIVTE